MAPAVLSLDRLIDHAVQARRARAAQRSSLGDAAEQASIGAFLFDVDGVISDTAKHHTAAWRRLAQEEGLLFDDEIAAELAGLSRTDSLKRLLQGRRLPADRFDQLLDRKNEYYVAALRTLSEADLVPGVLPLLRDLRDAGLRLAAVSLSRNARQVLLRVGVVEAFDAIVDGVDAAKSTSGLNRFLLAARALRVEPGRCVVVEDSVSGVATARSVGMRTVGVGHHDRLCAATVVLESFSGTDASRLIRQLVERRPV